MPSEYSRPQGFPFKFAGIDLRNSPESIAPVMYSCAKNIRADSETSIRARPGYTAICTSAAGFPILTVRAYSTLGTDNLPRFLAYDDHGSVILDNGVVKSTLTAPYGLSASMIPFRPAQSQESWMYIATVGDYKKISAPDVSNNVIVNKVGIAEPPAQLEFAQAVQPYTDFSFAAATWTHGGTAGADSDVTRSTDTVIAIRANPVISTRYSVQVATTVTYQAGQILTFAKSTGGTVNAVVQEVIPPCPTGAGLTIKAITYDSGATGLCTIIPSQIAQAASPGWTYFGPLGPLVRGSLIRLNSAETVIVHEVIQGTDGSQAIRTSTTGTFTAGHTIDGLPAIVVDGVDSTVVGQTVTSTAIQSALTVGEGTLSLAFASPFNDQMGASGKLPQADDYIHFSLAISDYTKVVEVKLIFDIDHTTHDFQHNALYYSVEPSVIAATATNESTHSQAVSNQAAIDAINQQINNYQSELDKLMSTGFVGMPDESYYAYVESLRNSIQALEIQKLQEGINTIKSTGGYTASGYDQWTEILFPISELTRLGADLSRSLSDAYGVRVYVNCTDSVTIKVGSFWVGGGGAPDSGDSNADYRYVAVPRSAVGVIGNPTPYPRYGIRPRRQSVTINLPSAAYDTQIAYWDIYRYGGSITSYRYIGTALAAAATFTDNVSDSAASVGRALTTSNFEPWPSIDVPYSVTSGGGTTITATGPFIVISGPTSWPSTILRWLPGTLISINGQTTYTLRSRPTALSATSYRFEVTESANYGTFTSFSILEPIVANQKLPYLWGPDEQGVIFAVGDPLRPGSVYHCRPNDPDTTSDQYNLELCPPSEPLIGGEVIKGVSLVASTKRWWALYPNFDTNSANLYTKIEQPVGRPLIAPHAHCTDSANLYFFTIDGICATNGGPFTSLTDAALYTLFPHEGVPGSNITRNGVTFYAPDYKRAATFRLSVANKILYADYQDSTGTPRTLVLNLTTGAWSTDVYDAEISGHYSTEQQRGTLLTSTTLYPVVVLYDINGNLWKQTDNHNDNLATIACTLATFEWDAGDPRAKSLFGDAYLVFIPNSAITATPVSLGSSVVAATTIPASSSRQFSAISLSGGQRLNYLGLALTWTDDFTSISSPTQLFLWQPSVISQVETTNDRFGDWDDSGDLGNKFYQGFLIDCDTFNVAKSLRIRDADSNTLHTIQPTTITHNGRVTRAYTFPTPFIAHSVRYEPQDNIPWILFALKYIYEPTPEFGTTWETQYTAHGLTGFHHIGRLEISYSATADVTLTITSYDGTSPAALTLPSTTGATRKIILHPTVNKGQLFKYSAISASPFQIFLNDFTVYLGAWGRSSPYSPYRTLGGSFGDKAVV